MTDLHVILRIAVALIVVTAGAYDIRYRRIPNWLVLTGLLLGLALNPLLFGWPGLANSGLGIGLALLVYMPMYLLRGMGAGDVKLMGAVGAITGWKVWFLIFLFQAIIGGVLAVLLMLAKGRFQKTLWNTYFLLTEMVHLRPPHQRSEELDVRSSKAMRLPHGAVIALGALTYLGVLAFVGAR